MSAGVAFMRRAAPAAVGGLGNTANSSSALFQKPRERRFRLRLKAKKYADRSAVARSTLEQLANGDFRTVVAGMAARDDRMLACGWRARNGESVGVVYDEVSGVAGYSNVQSCGSVWACPVCAAKVASVRSADMENVLNWAREQGHTIALVTMTVRHSRDQPLSGVNSFVDDDGKIVNEPRVDPKTGELVAGVWDAVSTGWASVTSGSEWASENVEKFQARRDDWDARRVLAVDGKGRMPRGGRAFQEAFDQGDYATAETFAPQRRVGEQEKFGVVGWARAVEVTDGSNGWHVHTHAVLVLEGTPDVATVNAFRVGRSMWERWEKGIAKVGFTALRDSGGLDIRVARAAEKRLAEYLTKDGLSDEDEAAIRNSFHKASSDVAKEATLGNVSKSAKGGGLTPFQILERIDEEALEEGPTHPGYRAAARLYARWREWVRGSEGRRQMTWSDGLRELAGLAKEELDAQEIVDAAPGGELVLSFTRETWRAVRHFAWEPLEAVEQGGLLMLLDYMDDRGLEYFLPELENVSD